jgi:hypothetical protein
MADKWWQISGVAGILFVVLFVAGAIFTGDVPTYDDSGEEIAAWFADNSSQYLAGDFITGLAFILFYFPFLAGLYTKLRGAEGQRPVWSRAALMGGIAFPLAGLAGGISLAGLALLEGDVSADVASMAAAASYHGFGAAGALSAIVMGAASIVILRTRVLWNWLGWLGALLAVAAIIGSGSVLENDPQGVLAIFGFISFIGFGVWILAASVALFQSGEVVAT